MERALQRIDALNAAMASTAWAAEQLANGTEKLAAVFQQAGAELQDVLADFCLSKELGEEARLIAELLLAWREVGEVGVVFATRMLVVSAAARKAAVQVEYERSLRIQEIEKLQCRVEGRAGVHSVPSGDGPDDPRAIVAPPRRSWLRWFGRGGAEPQAAEEQTPKDTGEEELQRRRCENLYNAEACMEHAAMQMEATQQRSRKVVIEAIAAVRKHAKPVGEQISQLRCSWRGRAPSPGIAEQGENETRCAATLTQGHAIDDSPPSRRAPRIAGSSAAKKSCSEEGSRVTDDEEEHDFGFGGNTEAEALEALQEAESAIAAALFGVDRHDEQEALDITLADGGARHPIQSAEGSTHMVAVADASEIADWSKARQIVHDPTGGSDLPHGSIDTQEAVAHIGSTAPAGLGADRGDADSFAQSDKTVEHLLPARADSEAWDDVILDRSPHAIGVHAASVPAVSSEVFAFGSNDAEADEASASKEPRASHNVNPESPSFEREHGGARADDVGVFMQPASPEFAGADVASMATQNSVVGGDSANANGAETPMEPGSPESAITGVVAVAAQPAVRSKASSLGMDDAEVEDASRDMESQSSTFVNIEASIVTAQPPVGVAASFFGGDISADGDAVVVDSRVSESASAMVTDVAVQPAVISNATILNDGDADADGADDSCVSDHDRQEEGRR